MALQRALQASSAPQLLLAAAVFERRSGQRPAADRSRRFFSGNILTYPLAACGVSQLHLARARTVSVGSPPGVATPGSPARRQDGFSHGALSPFAGLCGVRQTPGNRLKSSKTLVTT